MKVKDIIKELHAHIKVSGVYVSECQKLSMFALLKSRAIWRRTDVEGKEENDIDGMVVKMSELSMTKDILNIHREKGMVLLMVGDCNGNTSNITAEVIDQMMKMVA